MEVVVVGVVATTRSHLLRAGSNLITSRPHSLDAFSIKPSNFLVIQGVGGVAFRLVSRKMAFWDSEVDDDVLGDLEVFGKFAHATQKVHLPLADDIVRDQEPGDADRV